MTLLKRIESAVLQRLADGVRPRRIVIPVALGDALIAELVEGQHGETGLIVPMHIYGITYVIACTAEDFELVG
jgi:hypothetical protein